MKQKFVIKIILLHVIYFWNFESIIWISQLHSRFTSIMTSEVRGVISWVLFASQISLALRKSLVTFGISSRFIVISSPNSMYSCVYVSSRTLSLKYHVTLGGGLPPITSHNRNFSLPSLNVSSILARVLLVSVYITGFFGGTVSKLNFDHRNLFP